MKPGITFFPSKTRRPSFVKYGCNYSNVEMWVFTKKNNMIICGDCKIWATIRKIHWSLLHGRVRDFTLRNHAPADFYLKNVWKYDFLKSYILKCIARAHRVHVNEFSAWFKCFWLLGHNHILKIGCSMSSWKLKKESQLRNSTFCYRIENWKSLVESVSKRFANETNKLKPKTICHWN